VQKSAHFCTNTDTEAVAFRSCAYGASWQPFQENQKGRKGPYSGQNLQTDLKGTLEEMNKSMLKELLEGLMRKDRKICLEEAPYGGHYTVPFSLW